MGKLCFENFDVSARNNKAICDLGEILWEITSMPNEESKKICQRLDEAEDSLLEALDPEQKALFERYQDKVEEVLILNQRQRFICGFKVAMRLTRESMK